jgi:hypothetical protein
VAVEMIRVPALRRVRTALAINTSNHPPAATIPRAPGDASVPDESLADGTLNAKRTIATQKASHMARW